MPWFALIARDRPNGLEHRKKHRPAHLEHMARLDAAGRLRYGGPLLNEKGEMGGSLIIVEADDLEAGAEHVRRGSVHGARAVRYLRRHRDQAHLPAGQLTP